MSMTNKHKPFRPMKGENVKDCLESLTFPCRASFKIDGIRAVNRGGVLVSNTIKPIPNLAVQAAFASAVGFDGELVCGEANDPNCMQNTSSAVMSVNSVSEVVWHVFDFVGGGWEDVPWDDAAWVDRQVELRLRAKQLDNPAIRIVEQRLIESLDELLAFEEFALSLGFEGVMLSWDGAPYLFGKAGPKKGWRNKLKRPIDGEAVVIGFKAWEENLNPDTVDARGLTVRGSVKEFFVPIDRMGSFICRDLQTGARFAVAGGTIAERDLWWQIRDTLIGKVIRYQSLPTGVVDAPRSPVLGGKFDGFRHPDDIADLHQTKYAEILAELC